MRILSAATVAATAIAIGLYRSVGQLLSETSTGGEGVSLAPFLTAGSGVTAAGALTYLVAQMVNGKLVARQSAEAEQKLLAALEDANEAMHEYKDIVRDLRSQR